MEVDAADLENYLGHGDSLGVCSGTVDEDDQGEDEQ